MSSSSPLFIWSLAALLSVAACTSSGLSERRVGLESSSPHQERGNWADADTDGLGTHRINGTDVNVRAGDLSQVRFTADLGDQLVLTQVAMDWNGSRYMEAVFKGGALDGEYGWVASQFLLHTQLEVCGNSVPIRRGTDFAVIDEASWGEDAYVVSSTLRNTGSHRYFEVSVHGTRGLVATDFLCRSGGSGAGGVSDGSRTGLASTLLQRHGAGALTLWDSNFGRNDGASALENVEDAAAGQGSLQSCDGNAPCGEVFLDTALLEGMRSLNDERGYDYFVTSIAGGVHSAGSRHYAGRAFDVDEVNGVRIQGDSSLASAFMNACWDLGATEVFGPSNDPYGHYDHIHCAW